jgi:hypothetical protein
MRASSSLLLTLFLTLSCGIVVSACGDDGGGAGGDAGLDPDGDLDNDGIPNGEDDDIDGDGVPNEDDPCPLDTDPTCVPANTPDAGGGVSIGDATIGGACEPEDTQCNNCEDDDGDGLTDGDDPECTGALDNDEGSFATGIPGDNKDTKWQDCFFDGNSGAGDDGCRFHTCCLLGATGGADCPVDQNFKPNKNCPEQTQECIDFCAPLTPPGCDCFGCCTICDPETDDCRDVLTNPAVAPDCSLENILDEEACPSCEKNEECGGESCDDDPTDCILCPGQTEEDLPDSCDNMNECPGGGQACEPAVDDCPAGEYCSNSCCVSIVD